MILGSNGEYVLLSEKEKLLVLEAGLMASGYEFELGVGVSAAQRSLT